MNNKSIKIDFLIKMNEKDGQGVQSASLEDLHLLQEMGKGEFDISVNKNYRSADIIHVCDVHPRFFFKLRKRKCTVCLVHFIPETLDGSINLNPLFFKVFKKYVLAFYRRAKELVTVNPVYVENLVKLGFSRDHITYIPNFVSSDQFHPLSHEEKKALRGKYGYKEGDFIVLSCGQTQPRKGIYDFIELAKKMPQVQFLWVGGFTFGAITSDHDKIQKIFENHPSNVQFTGLLPRNQLNEMYNLSDAFLSQSYDELFPMTILEASAVHLPILVRNLSLYEPILFDNVIKCDTNDDFEKALTRLKEDLTFQKQKISLSEELSNRYTKEKVYSIWRDFYKSILKKQG